MAFWPLRLASTSTRSLGLVVTQTMLHSNLPAQVSSFIGREAELVAVRALVGGSRLVTLTGAGGAPVWALPVGPTVNRLRMSWVSPERTCRSFRRAAADI